MGPYAIFKVVLSGYFHTKNQKNRWSGCRNVLENAYFSHLFCHFRPKKIFSCKTAYTIFKVVYQASHIPKIRKSMVWLPRNAQKCIFFTPFSPFLAKKKIFFKNPASSVFWGTIESYLDTKNQKKLWSGSSGIHPDVRTDGRTDGREQIYSLSQILWVGPKI